MHALALRRSGIMPGHGAMDPRLIEEHALARLQLTYFLLMATTLFWDRFTVTLCGVIRLFLRVRFTRARVRCLLARRGVT